MRFLSWQMLLLLVAGCASPKPYDYSAFLDHPPRSILILPPLNDSPEVDAPYAFLTTVTRPLAEHGYYVFPVAVVDQLMKQNGLPTPGEMHGVSAAKLREVFGADCVLKAHIRQWGVRYVVLSSVAEIVVDLQLLDLESGVELWSGQLAGTHSTNSGGGGLIGAMAGALITQVAEHPHTRSIGLCRGALHGSIRDPWRGLPIGPYHSRHEEDRRRIGEMMAARP